MDRHLGNLKKVSLPIRFISKTDIQADRFRNQSTLNKSAFLSVYFTVIPYGTVAQSEQAIVNRTLNCPCTFFIEKQNSFSGEFLLPTKASVLFVIRRVSHNFVFVLFQKLSVKKGI